MTSSTYIANLLRRHGLEDAPTLSDALPDWEEDAQREWFAAAWPLFAAQATRIERHLSPEGGESVYRIDDARLLVSDDIWCFEVIASPGLLVRIADAMRKLRNA